MEENWDDVCSQRESARREESEEGQQRPQTEKETKTRKRQARYEQRKESKRKKGKVRRVLLSVNRKANGSVSHSVGSNSLQPMDSSPPGSSVHEILQARIWNW